MTDGLRKHSVARESFESLLVAFIFVNFIRIFVFQASKIPSGSMSDTLLVGDHIIVNKFVFGAPSTVPLIPWRDIERGDIVVFRFPKNPAIDYVKRVIGLPGDEVMIRDKRVFVNGRALAEPYKTTDDEQTYPIQPALPEPWRSRDQFGPVRILPGHFFVLGDNRDHSNDSRYWGTVPRELIKGRAFLVYWSFATRGTPYGTTTVDRSRELVAVLTHFFRDTRWERTFMVIDSKYHYHASDSPRS